MSEIIVLTFGNDKTESIEWETPTCEEIEENNWIINNCIRDFYRKYEPVETFLSEQFKNHYFCNNFHDVLLKATLINTFYNTHMNNDQLIQVAKRIVKLNTDYQIKNSKGKEVGLVDYYLDKETDKIRSRELVNYIAYCKLEKEAEAEENTQQITANNQYVFASKFCSWHRPDCFPIVDSYVLGLLYRLYNTNDKSPNYLVDEKLDGVKSKTITAKAMYDYNTFCELYDAFMNAYIIKGHESRKAKYTYKRVDEYAWNYMNKKFYSLQKAKGRERSEAIKNSFKIGVSKDDLDTIIKRTLEKLEEER